MRRRSRALAMAAAIVMCAAAMTYAQEPQEPAVVGSLPLPAPTGWFAISRTGTVAAAVCGGSKLVIWSLPGGHVERTIEFPARNLDLFVMSDDGRSILLADHLGKATIWDASTGTVRAELTFPRYFAAAAFSHDGTRIAIAPVHLGFQIYDVASRRKLAESRDIPGSTSGALTFSPDDSLIASADGDTAVRIYRTRDATVVATNNDFLLEPLAATFSRDGKQLIAAGADKTIALLDATTGATSRKFPAVPDPIFALGLSNNGTLLVAGTLHADNLGAPAPIIVWDLATATTKREWTPPTPAIAGSWINDGHLLIATATRDTVQLWRVY